MVSVINGIWQADLWKIWRYHYKNIRKNLSTNKSSGRKVQKILVLLIESSVMYCLIWVSVFWSWVFVYLSITLSKDCIFSCCISWSWKWRFILTVICSVNANNLCKFSFVDPHLCSINSLRHCILFLSSWSHHLKMQSKIMTKILH